MGLEPERALTVFIDTLKNWVELFFFGGVGGVRMEVSEFVPKVSGLVDSSSDSPAEGAPTACCLCSEEKDTRV